MSQQWCEVTYNLHTINELTQLVDYAWYGGFFIGFMLPIMAYLSYKLVNIKK